MKKLLIATALVALSAPAFAADCKVGNRGTVVSSGALYGQMIVRTYTPNGVQTGVFTAADLGVDSLLDKAAVEAATGCVGFDHEVGKKKKVFDEELGEFVTIDNRRTYW